MGILDAPTIDWRSDPLAKLVTSRDLPALVAHYDASNLTALTDGASVLRWGEVNGSGKDLLIGANATANPTIKLNDLNGLPTIHLPAGAYFYSQAFANSALSGGLGWGQPASIAQPYSLVCVFKTTAAIGANVNVIVSGNGQRLTIGSTSIPYLALYAGTYGAKGGPAPNDGNWHIAVGYYGTGSGWLMLDGVLIATSTTQSHSTNALQQLGVGADPTGANPMTPGAVAEVMALQGVMTPQLAGHITTSLARKWGLSATFPQQQVVTWQDKTEPTANQTMRVFAPPPHKIGSTCKLVIVNHQQNGTTAVTPDFFAYTFIHALVCQGYVVVLNNNHGIDGWSGTPAENDNLYTKQWVDTNIAPVSETVLIGYSMGGCLSVIVAKDSLIPNLKGVYLIDAAVNLTFMYTQTGYTVSINDGLGITNSLALSANMGTTGLTSLPTTASFPTTGTQLMIGAGTANFEVVTTTGPSTGTAIPITATTKTHVSADPVSDYPVKSVGKDPCLLTSGQLPQGIRWRAIASTSDSTVLKVDNTDVFMPIAAAAGALESATITHLDGHIGAGASVPLDVLDFVNRCFA